MPNSAPPPGWYPDPSDGSRRRYWDGHAWGPAEPASQPPPLAPWNKRPGLVIIGVTGAVLLVVLIVVAIVASGSHNSGSPGAGSVRSGGVSGSRDDWLQAVCRQGTFFDGGTTSFRNATGTGSCMPAERSAQRIWIGQWDSAYLMRNDMIPGHAIRFYAWGQQDTLFTAFAVHDVNTASLEPLTQFGFTIDAV
jgi:hypothetical protein